MPKLKIAIVDDQKSNLKIMGKYLTREGFEVCTATNGKEAVALVQSERPDLVLMDLKMPVMSGLEATLQIKADPTINQIPIYALSAQIRDGDGSSLKAVGFDGWCQKPIKAGQLVELVRRWADPTDDIHFAQTDEPDGITQHRIRP